jgi:Flp pilus assembly protein TadG
MARIGSRFTRMMVALRERRGVAAVELAITLPVLAAMIVPIADLGLGLHAKIEVMDAVEAGAQYAVLHGFDEPSAVESAVTNATSLTSISVTPAPTESCGCASGTTISAVACGNTCPNGHPAGTYVTVNAQATYSPILHYPVLGSSVTLTAQQTVRIQ